MLLNLRANLPRQLLFNISERCWKMLSESTSVGQHDAYSAQPVIQNAPPSYRQARQALQANDWSAGALSVRACYTSIISTTIDSIERGTIACAAA